MQRGTILNVPYLEKEEAKGLGAWWDPEIKKWFVPKGVDIRPFKKWIPPQEQTADASNGTKRAA